MPLSDVSRTAIATLRSRAIESGKDRPLIEDPMAGYCLERLAGLASEEDEFLFGKKLSSALTLHIALRARKYDAITNEFISNHPSSLVVNLGCGFDTRYWRIDHGKCEYVELDLPEIIELKKAILKDRLDYGMIGTSVLDPSWIDEVNRDGKKKTLLLAEGLFMYLPKSEVVSLFETISERFHDSRIVMEVVTEKYTRGIWKKIVVRKMKRELGFDAGSSYEFGVRCAREIESYGKGLKVVKEWSYVEDPDIRPKILKYLGVSRTQWTVTVDVNV